MLSRSRASYTEIISQKLWSIGCGAGFGFVKQLAFCQNTKEPSARHAAAFARILDDNAMVSSSSCCLAALHPPTEKTNGQSSPIRSGTRQGHNPLELRLQRLEKIGILDGLRWECQGRGWVRFVKPRPAFGGPQSTHGCESHPRTQRRTRSRQRTRTPQSPRHAGERITKRHDSITRTLHSGQYASGQLGGNHTTETSNNPSQTARNKWGPRVVHIQIWRHQKPLQPLSWLPQAVLLPFERNLRKVASVPSNSVPRGPDTHG
jgi:hypothetical protein